MRGVIFGFLSFCLLPTSVLAVGYSLHVGDRTFTLSQTKYTTPSLAFGVPNDGVWYAPLTPAPQNDTLHVKMNTLTFSVDSTDGYDELLTEYNCPYFFTDTENYTYDENGRLIGADAGIWLEGTGTQYIDTGHNPTTLTRSEVDLRFTDDTYKSSGKESFFGVVDRIKTKIYSINFGSLQNQGYRFIPWLCVYQQTPNCYYAQHIDINATLKTTKRTFVLDAKNKIARYGTSSRALNQPLTQPVDYAIYLYGRHAVYIDGTEDAEIYARNNGLFIYAARFYEDDVLVKHFVPVPACMRIGDFVVPENGMWDIVNQQFYGNSGTGEFIYGKD